MSLLDDDFAAPAAGGATLHEARFHDTAAAPGDQLHVTIAGFDGGEHLFGPVAWQPWPGPLYPAKGDWALVAESDEGTWTVLAWRTGRPVTPPGPPGGGAFTHTQSAAATVWTVTHGLGFRPSVSCFEGASGDEVEGDVRHLDANSLTVTFKAAVSGFAYLS